MKSLFWMVYLFIVASVCSGCASDVSAKPHQNPVLGAVVAADALAEVKLNSVPDLPDSLNRPPGAIRSGPVPDPIDGPSEQYTMAMIVLPRVVTGYYTDGCAPCKQAKHECKSLNIKFKWTKILTPGIARMVQEREKAGNPVGFPLFHWLTGPDTAVYREGWYGPGEFRATFEQSRTVRVSAAGQRPLAGEMPEPFGQILGDGPLYIPTGGKRSLKVGEATLTFGPDIQGQVQGNRVTNTGNPIWATVRKLGIPFSAKVNEAEIGQQSITAGTAVGRFTFPILTFDPTP